MTSAFRWSWRCLCALSIVFAQPVAALAQETTDSAEPDSHTRTAARTLASQGAEAFESGDFPTALDLFQRAGALIQAPTIMLMEARTLVELGRLVEAADKYSTTKNMSDAEGHNDTMTGAIEAAASELDALRPRIPLLNVQIVGPSERQALVWLDGREIPTPLLGVHNPVDPGSHSVEVRIRDQQPITRELTLREGERQELVIQLAEPEKPNPAPTPTSALPPDNPPQTMATPNNTAAYVALAIGGAGTLIGATTGVMAMSKKSELDEVCDPGCPKNHAGDIDSFRTYRTVSYAAFGVGLAGVAWGGYLVLSGSPQSAHVALRVSPAAAAFTGAF